MSLLKAYQQIVEKSQSERLAALFPQVIACKSEQDLRGLYNVTQKELVNYLGTLSRESQTEPRSGNLLQSRLIEILERIMGLLLFKNNLDDLSTFSNILEMARSNSPTDNSLAPEVAFALSATIYHFFQTTSLDLETTKAVHECLGKILTYEVYLPLREKVLPEIWGPSRQVQTIPLQEWLELNWYSKASKDLRNVPMHERLFQISRIEKFDYSDINVIKGLSPRIFSNPIEARDPKNWANFAEPQLTPTPTISSPELEEKLKNLQIRISTNQKPVTGDIYAQWLQELIVLYIRDKLMIKDKYTATFVFNDIMRYITYNNLDVFPIRVALGTLALIYHVHASSLEAQDKESLRQVFQLLINVSVVDKNANSHGKFTFKDVLSSLHARGTLWTAALNGEIHRDDNDSDYFYTASPTLKLLEKPWGPTVNTLSTVAPEIIPATAPVTVIEKPLAPTADTVSQLANFEQKLEQVQSSITPSQQEIDERAALVLEVNDSERRRIELDKQVTALIGPVNNLEERCVRLEKRVAALEDGASNAGMSQELSIASKNDTPLPLTPAEQQPTRTIEEVTKEIKDINLQIKGLEIKLAAVIRSPSDSTETLKHLTSQLTELKYRRRKLHDEMYKLRLTGNTNDLETKIGSSKVDRSNTSTISNISTTEADVSFNPATQIATTSNTAAVAKTPAFPVLMFSRFSHATGATATAALTTATKAIDFFRTEEKAIAPTESAQPAQTNSVLESLSETFSTRVKSMASSAKGIFTSSSMSSSSSTEQIKPAQAVLVDRNNEIFQAEDVEGDVVDAPVPATLSVTPNNLNKKKMTYDPSTTQPDMELQYLGNGITVSLVNEGSRPASPVGSTSNSIS